MSDEWLRQGRRPKGKNDQPDQRLLKRGARGLSTDTGVLVSYPVFFFGS